MSRGGGVAGATAGVATAADWPEVVALRTRVFVDEQGVPPEIEQDTADATAVHVLSRSLSGDLAGRVVATGRLLLRDDGTASIGRMAADVAVRGRGHGSAVLAELHRQAALRGVTGIELHAQLAARSFYERAGYTALGEVYEEAGIPHVTMVRSLRGRPPAGACREPAGGGGAGSFGERPARRDTLCQTLGVDTFQCEDRGDPENPSRGVRTPVFPAGRPVGVPAGRARTTTEEHDRP